MVELSTVQIREAMTASLREEAAPISRRLAEVKGLSNNAIRRLERLEGLIESERNARVDDLGLLVDLLTNGWRAMDARLARIEAAARGRALERRAPARERVARDGVSSPAGSTSSNRAPWPGSDSSSIRPPSAPESSLAIARPRPVPPVESRDEGPEETVTRLG